MGIKAAELYVQIGADTQAAVTGMQGVSNGLKKLAGDGETLGSVFTGVLGANLVQGAVSGLKNLGEEALSSYADYERLGLSLESLTAREKLNTGQAKTMAQALAMSKTEAQATLQWIQKLAIESPFTQAGVAKAYQQAQAYGFTSTEARRLTQDMIDFAAGSGRSEDVMNQIALALGQIKARGKLAGQEVIQLTQAGLDVNNILAKAFGKTTAQIVEMQQAGLIPANEAIEAIAQSLETDFGGAARRQTGTFTGLLSSLNDLKQVGLREFFGETFRGIQPDLDKFVTSLQDPETIAKIREMGAEFAATVEDMAGKAKGAVTWFTNLDGSTKTLLVDLGLVVALRGPIFGTLASITGGLASIGKVLPTVGAGLSLFKWGLGQSVLEAAGLSTIGITLGAIAVAAGSVVAVWYEWNKEITKTNEEGRKATSNALAVVLDQVVKSGGDATAVVEEYTATTKRMDDQVNQSGALSIFVDRQNLARDSLKTLGGTLAKTAISFDQYQATMLKQIDVTKLGLSTTQLQMIQYDDETGKINALRDAGVLLNKQEYDRIHLLAQEGKQTYEVAAARVSLADGFRNEAEAMREVANAQKGQSVEQTAMIEQAKKDAPEVYKALTKEIEEWAKAMDHAQELARNFFVDQSGMAESLKFATGTDLAKAAISNLDQALKDGLITMPQYNQAVQDMQLDFGLANKSSILYAQNIDELSLGFAQLGLDGTKAIQMLQQQAQTGKVDIGKILFDLGGNPEAVRGFLLQQDQIKKKQEELAGTTGQISDKAIIAQGQLDTLDTKFQSNVTNADLATAAAITYLDELGTLRDFIDKMEGKTITVNVKTVKTTTIVEPTTKAPPPNTYNGQTGNGYANGTDFIVPAGYPGDSYRWAANLTSGERVTVTPAGKQRGGGRLTVYGDLNVVVQGAGGVNADRIMAQVNG
jgi:tape measure domain-containing protein